MLARTSTIQHPGGGASLETPLLVPSFSSRAVGEASSSASQIGKILATTAEWLTESFLVSAYDIHYEYIPRPLDMIFTPDLIILDSGGYEIASYEDLSTITHRPPASHEWTLGHLGKELDVWPDEVSAMFVSYDNPRERKPFQRQVELARQLFKGRDSQLHTFLMKPEKESHQTIQSSINAATSDLRALRSFDAIGVTEKELGGSILERMTQIARFRRAMDEEGVTVPIHVFGALDPISTCLYFISGAEIFDGLTWIRYGFDAGRCIYPHNWGALKYGPHIGSDRLKSKMLVDNFYYLQMLQENLKDFEATGRFEKLPCSAFLGDAADSLERRLRKGRR